MSNEVSAKSFERRGRGAKGRAPHKKSPCPIPGAFPFSHASCRILVTLLPPMNARYRADVDGFALDLLLRGAAWVKALGLAVVVEAEHAAHVAYAETATDAFVLIDPWLLCHFILLFRLVFPADVRVLF